MLYSYALYETKTKFYIVATDQSQKTWKCLKVSKDSLVGDSSPITDDGVEYSKKQITDLLEMIADGNRSL
jgi:hypothetical protein